MFLKCATCIIISIIINRSNAYEDKNDIFVSDEDNLPTYLPKDFCARLVTNTSAIVQWVEPLAFRLEIVGYNFYYTRNPDLPLRDWNMITIGNFPTIIIRNLELGEVYTFKVQINSLGLEGDGPISDSYQFQMLNRTRSCYDHPTTSTIKTLNVIRAAATSTSTVEVWWNLGYDPHHVLGFQIIYGLDYDLANLYNKTVGLVQSTELTNLYFNSTYRIQIAAITKSGLDFYSQEATVTVLLEEVPLDVKIFDTSATSVGINWLAPIRFVPIKYKITYDAVKDFIDSSGIRQHLHYDAVELFVDGFKTAHYFDHLVPFTTYSINISAIPVDYSYRPAIKMLAQTKMAAPHPMTKPDIFGIINNNSVQLFLPKASEEFGPISYYYVIVVPNSDRDVSMPSNALPTEMLLNNRFDASDDINEPYIAAKFVSKIPYAFILGTGVENGFVNHKLNYGKSYKMFVRAVVVTPQNDLFTDSPYSDDISLDMDRSKLKKKY